MRAHDSIQLDARVGWERGSGETAQAEERQSGETARRTLQPSFNLAQQFNSMNRDISVNSPVMIPPVGFGRPQQSSALSPTQVGGESGPITNSSISNNNFNALSLTTQQPLQSTSTLPLPTPAKAIVGSRPFRVSLPSRAQSPRAELT